MSDNTVQNVKTVGPMKCGICIHGPLVCKRVVSNHGGPWLPAGDATKEEMQMALSAGGSRSTEAAYNEFWDAVFGAKGATK